MQSPPEYVPLYRRGSSEERVLHEPLLKEEVDRPTQSGMHRTCDRSSKDIVLITRQHE